MKNRVNLYQDTLRPNIDPLPLQRVVIIWLLVLIVSVAAAFFALRSERLARQELTVITNDVLKQQAAVKELQKELLRRQDLTELNQRIAELQREVADKLEILRYVQNESGKGATDYAQVMADLARYHKEGVWLTRIYVAGAELVLEGETSRPDELALWLEGLKRSAYFSGKAFSVLQFSGDEEVRRFRVATTEKGNAVLSPLSRVDSTDKNSAKQMTGILKQAGGQL